MWERFAYSQTLPFYGAVYTYSLPYRVYTGTTPSTDWWPGGSAADQWAVLPFTSTSATDTADYYEGLRPSLKLVGAVPHVVWHRWDSPAATQQASWSRRASCPTSTWSTTGIPIASPMPPIAREQTPGTLEQAQTRMGLKDTLCHGKRPHPRFARLWRFLPSTAARRYQLHVALHQRGAYVPRRTFLWLGCVVYQRQHLLPQLHAPSRPETSLARWFNVERWRLHRQALAMTKTQLAILWGLGVLVVVVLGALGLLLSRTGQTAAAAVADGMTGGRLRRQRRRRKRTIVCRKRPIRRETCTLKPSKPRMRWQPDAALVSAATSWPFVGLDDFSRPIDWTFQFYSPATGARLRDQC